MIRNSKRLARTGDQRCAAIGCCAGCKHIPTSAAKALDESRDRGVGGYHQARRLTGAQHTEVAALQTLNPHAFPTGHATSSTTSKPCWRRGRRLSSAFIPRRPFQQSAQLNPAGHLSPPWREPRQVFSPVSPFRERREPDKPLAEKRPFQSRKSRKG